MRHRHLLTIILVLAGIFAPPAYANDDPLCAASPPGWVYVDNQDWQSEQEHVHIEGCWPVFQHFGATGTIPLDLTVRLHNFPGVLDKVIVNLYGDFQFTPYDNLGWRCPVADCVRTFHVEVPLASARFSGLHVLIAEAWGTLEDGREVYTVPRWPLYLDNGKPAPGPDGGKTVASQAEMVNKQGLIGDGWLTNVGGDNYAKVSIKRADLPWDESTGDFKVKSGTWAPQVFMAKNEGFAYIDPALHAVPPSKGTVVYEGVGFLGSSTKFHTLSIDTTVLSNGIHRLLIGTCNTAMTPAGKHCGTLVVRFLVDNGTGAAFSRAPRTSWLCRLHA